MNTKAGVPWHERRDVWVTRDRRVILIKELDDDHLGRIIQFMQSKAVRRHKAHVARAIMRLVNTHHTEDNGLHSDAAEHFHFDLDRLIVADPKTRLRGLPVYQALCAEADRRAKAQGFVPAPSEWVPGKPSPRSRVFGPDECKLDCGDDISGVVVRDGNKFTSI